MRRHIVYFHHVELIGHFFLIFFCNCCDSLSTLSKKICFFCTTKIVFIVKSASRANCLNILAIDWCREALYVSHRSADLSLFPTLLFAMAESGARGQFCAARQCIYIRRNGLADLVAAAMPPSRLPFYAAKKEKPCCLLHST